MDEALTSLEILAFSDRNKHRHHEVKKYSDKKGEIKTLKKVLNPSYIGMFFGRRNIGGGRNPPPLLLRTLNGLTKKFIINHFFYK